MVSIIILNFNGQAFLENCIASVLKTNYPDFEVILVDNASTDTSITALKHAFPDDPRLKIIMNPKNLGFSGGNNVGFSYAKGDYVAFLNYDTVVDADWLTPLVEAMGDESIGLAQSVILSINGETIQTAGWLYSDYLVLMHGVAKDKTSQTMFKQVFEVPVASGTSMIARRSLLDEVGLFDPSVPFFYDDTLLSFKVWLANKRVVTVPNSKIRHIGGAANAWNTRFTSYNFLKAKLCLLFDVYYRLGGLAKALFVTAFSTGLSFVYVLRQKNFNAALANIGALLWGLRNFRFLWQNRLSHWAKTKVSPEGLMQRFVRINLPTPFYLLPSRLGDSCFNFKASEFERLVLQAT